MHANMHTHTNIMYMSLALTLSKNNYWTAASKQSFVVIQTIVCVSLSCFRYCRAMNDSSTLKSLEKNLKRATERYHDYDPPHYHPHYHPRYHSHQPSSTISILLYIYICVYEYARYDVTCLYFLSLFPVGFMLLMVSFQLMAPCDRTNQRKLS